MAEPKIKEKFTSKQDSFASVAFWQFMAFIFLLAFAWVNELSDLASLVFGVDPSPPNIYRAYLMTAAIITAAVVSVGHTYEKQRAVLRHLLMTCAYCHRVKTDKGLWIHVEEFFLAHFPIHMDRSSCPECENMLKAVEGTEGKNLLESLMK